MLKLISLKKGKAFVQYDTPEKDIPSLWDFNPVRGYFTTIREATFDTASSKKLLQQQLSSSEVASIMATVSHTPKDKDYKQVMLWGEPFVDSFGYYVYVKHTVTWKPSVDVDLRFNTNIPHKLAEPDLAFLFR